MAWGRCTTRGGGKRRGRRLELARGIVEKLHLLLWGIAAPDTGEDGSAIAILSLFGEKLLSLASSFRVIEVVSGRLLSRSIASLKPPSQEFDFILGVAKSELFSESLDFILCIQQSHS